LHPETQTPASSDMMLKTLCAVKGEKKFFIDFGLPYRTDMAVFQQFSGFRDKESIEKYVKDGALKKVEKTPTSQGVSFAIYQLNCN
jgi:hypothetical protein